MVARGPREQLGDTEAIASISLTCHKGKRGGIDLQDYLAWTGCRLEYSWGCRWGQERVGTACRLHKEMAAGKFRNQWQMVQRKHLDYCVEADDLGSRRQLALKPPFWPCGRGRCEASH